MRDRRGTRRPEKAQCGGQLGVRWRESGVRRQTLRPGILLFIFVLLIIVFLLWARKRTWVSYYYVPASSQTAKISSFQPRPRNNSFGGATRSDWER